MVGCPLLSGTTQPKSQTSSAQTSKTGIVDEVRGRLPTTVPTPSQKAAIARPTNVALVHLGTFESHSRRSSVTAVALLRSPVLARKLHYSPCGPLLSP